MLLSECQFAFQRHSPERSQKQRSHVQDTKYVFIVRCLAVVFARLIWQTILLDMMIEFHWRLILLADKQDGRHKGGGVRARQERLVKDERDEFDAHVP